MKKKKREGWAKKLWMYFWTKKRIIKELNDINNILDEQILDATNHIKELEQNKIYYISLPDYNKKEIDQVQELIKQTRKKIQWSIPPILVFNREIKDIPVGELRKIIKKQR